MTTIDPARAAALEAVLSFVHPGMTIGLGSGRAVFALAEAIGNRWEGNVPLQAVVASSTTEQVAQQAGIPIVDLSSDVTIELAVDGADEVDHDLRLIKGGGAALLREKLVIAHAEQTVIIAQSDKYVARVGTNWKLPVEVVQFGWTTTRDRLATLSAEVTPRLASDGTMLSTDEGNYIVDVEIPPKGDLVQFATSIKMTLGVVEHGLFLSEASQVILGNPDGSTTILHREQ